MPVHSTPKTDKSFASLPLKPALLKTLNELGFSEMTDIQAHSLPSILAGKDVQAKAKTGSGKTAAFGLGLLSKLQVERFRIQALVLCPTRELADQVSKELRRLARNIHNIKILTLCGGMPFGPQLGSLEHGAHIVVGTPGRICDHLRKGSLRLDDVTTLVLDEADRMLDMGFSDAIDQVLSEIPSHRQSLLFSATYPEEIDSISAKVLYKPVEVSVDTEHTALQIEQVSYAVDNSEREQGLMRLLSHYQPESCVVFCNTKRESQQLADNLASAGFSALAIHGDLEQRQRDQVLVRFSNKSVSILVATDVAARGIDVKDLGCVINYELSRDPEVHVHRIGRTGRAGQQGLALNLCTPNEMPRASAIEDYTNTILAWQPLPTAKIEGYSAKMSCLSIDGGRKNKVRAGDILGALTKDAGLDGKAIGKIDIFDFHAYVAVERSIATQALKHLENGKIKGKKFKARRFR